MCYNVEKNERKYTVNKLDISENRLYIRKLTNVIKRGMHKKGPFNTFGRHCDGFIYILSGSCTYTFDDGYTFTVKTGDILYLAHKAVYRMDVHGDYNFIFCDFEFDDENLRKSDVYTPNHSDGAEDMFKRLYKCYTGASSNVFTDCMAILYGIYGLVIASAETNDTDKKNASHISKVKAYIDANYKDTTLNIPLLAEKAGVSEVYFRKLFKNQYGISPSGYIEKVRLDTARQMMKYSFFTIEECALQNGFTSVQYFCRVFKKMYGQTPGEYRKQI